MQKTEKKVLVTGGAGYIGSILVKELLAKGYQVRVFDSLIFGKDHLADIESKIEMVRGDVRQFPASALEGCLSVIHMGSLSNDPTAEFDPKANHEINCEGTIRVAEACKETGIKRMTFASSAAVYGFHVDSIADEQSHVDPQSEYAQSKLDAENALLKMMDKRFCPVILRQATVFGLSPRMRWDLVVNTMTKDAFSRGKIAVFCEGENWRPLVWVKDVAKAHIKCIEAPESGVKGQIFNLVHDNLMILELAGVIKGNLDKTQRIKVDVMSGERESRSYRISGEKMKRVLGYEPKGSIKRAVNRIFTALLQGHYTDFENPIYYNLQWMKKLSEKEQTIKKINGKIFDPASLPVPIGRN
jgi:nucleoside-diphosphate-sugar epimerase